MSTFETDAQLQAEQNSPKIPTIEVKSPSFSNSTVRRDKVGSVDNSGSTASGFDIKSELSENNMHEKFVNTQSLGRDD